MGDLQLPHSGQSFNARVRQIGFDLGNSQKKQKQLSPIWRRSHPIRRRFLSTTSHLRCLPLSKSFHSKKKLGRGADGNESLESSHNDHRASNREL
jgi:hypothetical protein